MFCKIYQRSIKLLLFLVFMGASNSCIVSGAVIAAPRTIDIVASVDLTEVVSSAIKGLIDPQNTIIPLQKNNEILSTFFCGQCHLPNIAPNHYISRFIKYIKHSPACYALSLIYIYKMIKILPHIFNQSSFYRIFLVAMLVASKFVEDERYSNRYWALVGGLNVEELNFLEKIFVFYVLDCKIFISAEYFQGFTEALCLLFGPEKLPIQAITKKGQELKNVRSFQEGVIDAINVCNIGSGKFTNFTLDRTVIHLDGQIDCIVKCNLM